MSLLNPDAFGDHLVFVDESGDHELARVDPGYAIVAKKFRRSPAGEMEGWGLKVFP